MRFYSNILAATTLLAAFSTCMTSCSGDADNGATDSLNDDKYITISIVIDNDDTTTRATGPQGGEDGDGRQKGSTAENTINSVTLLLYQGSGINADGTQTIEQAIYVDQFDNADTQNGNYDSKPTLLSKSVVDAIQGKTYHVIAVCNKNLTGLKDKTLSEVRNYLIDTTWDGTNLSASNFVMSSEEDATIVFDGDAANHGSGEQSNPYHIASSTNGDQSIQVERLAARIDIDASNGTVGTVTYSGNTYDCVTFAKTGSTTVYSITNIVPVNIQMGGAYLIKRTDDTTNPYLAAETKDADNKATNIVIDAYWANKNNGTYFTPGESDYSSYAITTNNSDIFLSYANENTFNNPTAGDKAGHVTGVKFIGYKVVNGTPEPFTCTYLIRHSDPLGTALDSDPMKYGIVRNNIYLITPEAAYTAPEEDGLVINIKVKKWSVHTHSVIYM